MFCELDKAINKQYILTNSDIKIRNYPGGQDPTINASTKEQNPPKHFKNFTPFRHQTKKSSVVRNPQEFGESGTERGKTPSKNTERGREGEIPQGTQSQRRVFQLSHRDARK